MFINKETYDEDITVQEIEDMIEYLRKCQDEDNKE